MENANYYPHTQTKKKQLESRKLVTNFSSVLLLQNHGVYWSSKDWFSLLNPTSFLTTPNAASEVVSSRFMIHREERVLDIFIQHQYPVLTDTYKKHWTISYKQLTKQQNKE